MEPPPPWPSSDSSGSEAMSRTTNCLGEGVLKTFLIISNVIVLLAGLTLLFVGVISLSQRIEYFEDYCEALRRFASETASFIHQIVYFAPYVLITFGGFLTAISFLGCCGAFTESRVMLGIYASVLALLLLGQLVVGAPLPLREPVTDGTTVVVAQSILVAADHRRQCTP